MRLSRAVHSSKAMRWSPTWTYRVLHSYVLLMFHVKHHAGETKKAGLCIFSTRPAFYGHACCLLRQQPIDKSSQVIEDHGISKLLAVGFGSFSFARAHQDLPASNGRPGLQVS